MQLRKRRKRQESSSCSSPKSGGACVLHTLHQKEQEKQRTRRLKRRVSSSSPIITTRKNSTRQSSSSPISSSCGTDTTSSPSSASSVSAIDFIQEEEEEEEQDLTTTTAEFTHNNTKLTHFFLLQSAVTHEDAIDDTNWLTSTFIDLTLWKLANLYPCVYFLPTDFVHLYLSRTTSRQKTRQEYQVYDLLGRLVDYENCQSIVFVANIGHIHWNMFRVQLTPSPELQLFEPMGRPATRKGTRTLRSVPRQVIEWLDICFPQYQKWIDRTVSAITKQQQVSGFDCGVACLLYAEKCGKGQLREDINEWTDQLDITTFRKKLQSQLLIKQLPPIQETLSTTSATRTA